MYEMFLKEKFLSKRKGLSLLEVVIAIAIISFGLTAVATLSIYTTKANQRNEQALIATNLAREAVEVVKQKRNSNWLSCDDWDDDGFCSTWLDGFGFGNEEPPDLTPTIENAILVFDEASEELTIDRTIEDEDFAVYRYYRYNEDTITEDEKYYGRFYQFNDDSEDPDIYKKTQYKRKLLLRKGDGENNYCTDDVFSEKVGIDVEIPCLYVESLVWWGSDEEDETKRVVLQGWFYNWK